MLRFSELCALLAKAKAWFLKLVMVLSLVELRVWLNHQTHRKQP
jgi:hypothetical protein